MSFEHLPEKARNSLLIQTLDAKLQQPPNADFDYRGELVRLARQVTADVSHINELFPEYTPHDALYHLNRLFHVADLLIEKKRFESLNAAELFVLAASLYAHDWGMAVSTNEREAILGLIEGKEPKNEFAILNDEKEKLLKFSACHGCNPKETVEVLTYWRDYVRETHPERSAVRARLFFEKAGGGIADAVARASRGHGIDIAELDKPNEFPIDFSVHGLNVNLRGIAVYVRLIDLLDIADDRTPYAVWQFVSPQDPKSISEWSKHRALNPVTCPPYQNGRMILIDGSTGDPDVWAALRDLERYIKAQVRECSDLLARMGDNRFHLDLPIVEWRIATPGFKPIDLRFEFQRESMFRILSDEIYEGDIYVFLRELLQNSIDAIRLRSALLAQQSLTMSGIIHFEVEQDKKGTTRVHCRDNGIGMDEHIIRNYLALAGRSYYSSDEFKHLGLEIDAISRFGIGILSCFMAGDSIEIQTKRDPSLSSDAEALHVIVPAVERQFRVYPGGSQLKTGTTVTVHICEKKLKNAPEGWNAKLRVADYLAEVGGFTEFPILVSEDNTYTLILNPSHNKANVLEIASKTLGLDLKSNQITVRTISQDFPWSLAFLPQDEIKAKNAFRIRWFDLNKDLAIPDCEGRIGCLIPKNESIYAAAENPIDEPSVEVTNFFEKPNIPLLGVRWFDSLHSRMRFFPEQPTSISVVSMNYTSCNGILIAENEKNNDTYFVGYFSPNFAIWINFPRNKDIKLNVARLSVRENAPQWKDTITEHLHRYILTEEIPILCDMPPLDRILRIGQLMCWYKIDPKFICNLLPYDKWPVLKIGKHCNLEAIDHIAWTSDLWPILPEPLVIRSMDRFVEKFYNWPTQPDADLDKWQGEPALPQFGYRHFPSYVSESINFAAWVGEVTRPIKRIRFIKGPRSKNDIIPQFVSQATQGTFKNIDVLIDQSLISPDSLSPQDWMLVISANEELSYQIHRYTGWFLPPHENFFACGCAAWNAQHLLIQTVIRCSIALNKAQKNKSLSKEKLGILSDSIRNLENSFSNAIYSQSTCQHHINSCITDFTANNIITFPPNIKAPNAEEFVPGTIFQNESSATLLILFTGRDIANTFGKSL